MTLREEAPAEVLPGAPTEREESNCGVLAIAFLSVGYTWQDYSRVFMCMPLFISCIICAAATRTFSNQHGGMNGICRRHLPRHLHSVLDQTRPIPWHFLSMMSTISTFSQRRKATEIGRSDASRRCRGNALPAENA